MLYSSLLDCTVSIVISIPPSRALIVAVDPAERNCTELEVTAASEFIPPPM